MRPDGAAPWMSAGSRPIVPKLAEADSGVRGLFGGGVVDLSGFYIRHYNIV
jgi:hypothetical protein